MIVIGVCDDNKQFAQLLCGRLTELSAKAPSRIDIKIAPIFTSADQVTEYLQGSTIDVLFLDIDMPSTNGFQLAKMLGETHPSTIVVFVSAYDELVYSSFEYCPFRFLRKAHLSRELDITFEKVIERCTIDNEALLFDTTEGEMILRVKDILYFEGQRNYFYIYTLQGKQYKCRGTMDSLEKRTQDFDFFRIHSSYIVNHQHIESINSSGFVTMKNRKSLSISKRRMASFKASYMEFIRRRVTR